MPGDPFLHISGNEGEEIARFSEAQRRYYIECYGLDRPITAQYASYMAALLKGDLGRSLYYNDTVWRILVKRLPWTAMLVISAVLLSSAFGMLLGGISAWRRNRWLDGSIYFLLIMVSEIPAFLLGLALLLGLAAGLDLFPLSGAFSHFTGNRGIGFDILDRLHHAALPVLALTLVRIGGMYLISRNSMIYVIASDYVRTAVAKGLEKKRILLRHILRNALLPIVTRVFLSLGALVGGAILVENVFAYPGLGLLMREAVVMHDYPLVQGIFLLVTVSVLTANFLADIIYTRLDPRVAAGRISHR
jgi:peptide/nickel transport system permease protein